MITFLRLFLFIVLSVLILGCSSKGSAVTGTVSFEDGTRLTTGMVIFESGSHAFSGKIQPDGAFRLIGTSVKTGIPDGTYVVTIVKAVETATDRSGNPTARDLIDPKYSQQSTSELTCTVKGKTTLNITVSKPKS
ncbi:MAG: hypothetical protein LBG58_11785 [Planctomycetaceae bacterium]|nr:hypothetical protein [Planctomycetaceae bacterium]